MSSTGYLIAPGQVAIGRMTGISNYHKPYIWRGTKPDPTWTEPEEDVCDEDSFFASGIQGECVLCLGQIKPGGLVRGVPAAAVNWHWGGPTLAVATDALASELLAHGVCVVRLCVALSERTGKRVVPDLGEKTVIPAPAPAPREHPDRGLKDLALEILDHRASGLTDAEIAEILNKTSDRPARAREWTRQRVRYQVLRAIDRGLIAPESV